ncbi:hypothetical protein LTR84_006148 [Exophiala bonariae]|uniref:CCHC-type domain-containing protein n=1 Tax=Exophiala bonariae TaxID=1690606 RepID=A0AAV9N1Z3_9EURO|nr:hypothetical protein LTR84_006148 [Exophiala bonariae]
MADRIVSTPPRATKISPTRRTTRPKVCLNCKMPGHFARECRAPYMCWNCGKLGHIQKYCRTPRFTEQPTTSRYAGPMAEIAAAAHSSAPPPPPAPRPTTTCMSMASNPTFLLVRCDTCGTRSHKTERCPVTVFGFSDAKERAVDELPSFPVLIKPIKTAAALETERRYKEKLAAREKGGEKAETEEGGERTRVSRVNEPGDLIEFD